MSRRTDRVSELIQQEVAKLIQEEVDQDIGLITVTAAKVTPDLRWADIWVSILQKETKRTLETLKRSLPAIQHQLDRRLKEMKYVPRIRFKIDRTGRQIDRIDRLLKKIKTQD